MKVKNIKRPSDNDCQCGSWLNHWIKFSKAKKVGLCKEFTCINIATVGAHVIKSNAKDKNTYILPLCPIHNNLINKEISVFGTPTLVPMKVPEICG